MNKDDNLKVGDFKEIIETLIARLMKRFNSLDEKLNRLSRVKDVMEEDELLDNQDVCLLLGITYRTLQRYKQFKILPYQKIKGKSYYKKSDVLKALNK